MKKMEYLNFANYNHEIRIISNQFIGIILALKGSSEGDIIEWVIFKQIPVWNLNDLLRNIKAKSTSILQKVSS